MRKSRFSEEQIAYVLRQADAGTPVPDVCRGAGISEATFYVWKKQYANLGMAELRKLRLLKDKNTSCVRACRLGGISRAAWYRKSTAKDQTVLCMRIRKIAMARPRFGFQRIHIVLRREGWLVNRKRVHRLYRLDGLQVRMRVRRRKRLSLHRGPAPCPVAANERWSMDFLHDQLASGRAFRVLTVVDN